MKMPRRTQLADALGMRLRVGQRQRRAPRSAEHLPARRCRCSRSCSMSATRCQVVLSRRAPRAGGCARSRAGRTARCGSARIEEAPRLRVAAGAGPAMHEYHRLALRIAAFLEIDPVQWRHLQEARIIGFDFGVERASLRRLRPFAGPSKAGLPILHRQCGKVTLPRQSSGEGCADEKPDRADSTQFLLALQMLIRVDVLSIRAIRGSCSPLVLKLSHAPGQIAVRTADWPHSLAVPLRWHGQSGELPMLASMMLLSACRSTLPRPRRKAIHCSRCSSSSATAGPATFQHGKGKDTHCYEPMYGGKFIRDKHVVKGKQGDYLGETTYGFDPRAKQIVYWYISSDGDIDSAACCRWRTVSIFQNAI